MLASQLPAKERRYVDENVRRAGKRQGAMMRTMEFTNTYHIMVKSTHLPACLPLSSPPPSCAWCSAVSVLVNLRMELTGTRFLTAQTWTSGLSVWKTWASTVIVPARSHFAGRDSATFPTDENDEYRAYAARHRRSTRTCVLVASFRSGQGSRRVCTTCPDVSLGQVAFAALRVCFLPFHSQHLS